MNQALSGAQRLADAVPGIFAPRVNINKRDSRRRYFLRLKNINQIVKAVVGNTGQAPDTGFSMHVPAMEPGHDLKKCTFTALGKPQNSNFHERYLSGKRGALYQ